MTAALIARQLEEVSLVEAQAKIQKKYLNKIAKLLDAWTNLCADIEDKVPELLAIALTSLDELLASDELIAPVNLPATPVNLPVTPVNLPATPVDLPATPVDLVLDPVFTNVEQEAIEETSRYYEEVITSPLSQNTPSAPKACTLKSFSPTVAAFVATEDENEVVTCYAGFSNKQRAERWARHLAAKNNVITRFAIRTPVRLDGVKHELKLWGMTRKNVELLATKDLNQEPDAPDNTKSSLTNVVLQTEETEPILSAINKIELGAKIIGLEDGAKIKGQPSDPVDSPLSTTDNLNRVDPLFQALPPSPSTQQDNSLCVTDQPKKVPQLFQAEPPVEAINSVQPPLIETRKEMPQEPTNINKEGITEGDWVEYLADGNHYEVQAAGQMRATLKKTPEGGDYIYAYFNEIKLVYHPTLE